MGIIITHTSIKHNPFELFPWFVNEYFQNKKLSNKTVQGYEKDFLVFFDWLLLETKTIPSISKISLSDLDQLKINDAKRYKFYLQNEKSLSNSSVARKLSSISSLFHYLANVAEYDDGEPYIEQNIFYAVPKNNKKNSNLEATKKMRQDLLFSKQEFDDFVNFVRSGFELTIKSNKEFRHYEKNKERNTAVISLLLGSGIRISELSYLNIHHIDFDNNILNFYTEDRVKRNITFTSSAKMDLITYLKVRKERYNPLDNLSAVFLTNYDKQAKPMNLRSVQQMIKKYVEAYGKEGLSAQKFRHSFAARVYNQSNSLEILEDVLGQSSINPVWLYTRHIEEKN